MAGRALVDEVTCAEPYEMAPTGGVPARCHLAVYDFGVKANILRSLVRARRAPDRPAGADLGAPSASTSASTAWCSRTARATPSP